MKFLAAFACLFAVVLALDEDMESRIVNGQNANLYSHPHQASLQLWQATSGWFHICGAVLIGPNKFLTAAHCIDGQNYRNLRLEIGQMNLTAPANAYKQTLAVASIVKHPSYNPNGSGYPNDIGKVYTVTNVVYNKNVQPATLASSGDSFANTECVLTGWGRLYGGGPTSAYLQEVNVRKITNTQCNSIWSSVLITSSHICAFSEHLPSGTRPSACNGDSGGPMMCGPSKGQLAGITSFGVSTCSGDMPSVYTRVSSYLTWINAS